MPPMRSRCLMALLIPVPWFAAALLFEVVRRAFY